MSAPVKPTYRQSFVTTTLLLLLSSVTAPLSFAITTVIWFAYSRKAKPLTTSNKHTTVLVTGARTTKSLVLARIFWKAGYRVILADEAEWGNLAASRFSRCIAKYYNLPDPTKDHALYKMTLWKIITSENVSLWVCGSSAGATMHDAIVADELKKLPELKGVRFFIQSPEEASQLHNKDLFTSLCQDLGFKVPESILVSSVNQAVSFLHNESRRGRKFIVKCTALDDQGRSDLTQLPFESAAKTRAHLTKMPRPISKENPYVLQQFIDGFEFCTHCHAVDGVMQSFLCCPSSDMLMRYMDCKTNFSQSIAEDAEQWTRDFLERWKTSLKDQQRNNPSETRNISLTGHFSFDFIVDSEGTLYPIECNPRVHTAIVLLSSANPQQMALSYFGKKENGLIHPDEIAKERYSWIFHALPLALASYLIPNKETRSKIHPLLVESSMDIDPLKTSVPAITISPPVRSRLSEIIMNYINGNEIDPMLDFQDPFPFAFQHLTWTWLLVRLVYYYATGWSRLNVSTSRIFTC